jgi:hypothetical protein
MWCLEGWEKFADVSNEPTVSMVDVGVRSSETFRFLPEYKAEMAVSDMRAMKRLVKPTAAAKFPRRYWNRRPENDEARTHTLGVCNTTFPWRQWIRERACMLSYAYIAFVVVDRRTVKEAAVPCWAWLSLLSCGRRQEFGHWYPSSLNILCQCEHLLSFDRVLFELTVKQYVMPDRYGPMLNSSLQIVSYVPNAECYRRGFQDERCGSKDVSYCYALQTTKLEELEVLGEFARRQTVSFVCAFLSSFLSRILSVFFFHPLSFSSLLLYFLIILLLLYIFFFRFISYFVIIFL